MARAGSQPLTTNHLSTQGLARLHDSMAAHVASGRLPGLTTLVACGDDVHVDTIGTPSFVDDIETAREPDDENEEDEDAGAGKRQRPAIVAAAASPGILVARAALAAEQLIDAAIDVTPDLVEIGRPAAAALTPLRVVEGHDGCLAAGLGGVASLIGRV